MTKYILHGGYTRVDNESNRAFFTELVKDVPSGGTVLLVYFASEPGDDIEQRFNNHRKQILNLIKDKTLNFEQADTENFISQLRKAQAVYFNGGDTNILLRSLSRYSNLINLFKGKTIAGSSAGAYALVSYGTAHSEEHVRKGLGALPVRVICHYKSQDLPPSESSVKEILNLGTDLELIYLKDFEWRVFEVE